MGWAKPQEDRKRQLSYFWIKEIRDSGAGDECWGVTTRALVHL